MSEIRNKVQESSLVTIDLMDFLPKTEWKSIDIADFLDQGLILREKEFRNQLAQIDFEPYRDSYVHLYCSTEAIFPEWVFLLFTQYLFPIAEELRIGTKDEVDAQLLMDLLKKWDYEQYQNKALILKGCHQKIVQTVHLVYFYERALPFAKQIMYGEACSAVPLYKKQKL